MDQLNMIILQMLLVKLKVSEFQELNKGYFVII